MSETITKTANEVVIGDLLHFPNSRHAQEVTFLEHNEASVTFGTTGTQWVIALDKEVQVDLPKTDE
jgi:hypothetical protein